MKYISLLLILVSFSLNSTQSTDTGAIKVVYSWIIKQPNDCGNLSPCYDIYEQSSREFTKPNKSNKNLSMKPVLLNYVIQPINEDGFTFKAHIVNKQKGYDVMIEKPGKFGEILVILEEFPYVLIDAGLSINKKADKAN